MRWRKPSSACRRVGARRSATASTSSMLRWFSPKITDSGAASFMCVPERVEVEPLQRCLQATRRQLIGVALHTLLHDRIALAAAPANALGEGVQVDPVAFAVFQTEQQVDRAFQQPGQQPGPLWKCGRLAEEIRCGGTCAMQRNAVAGDGQPLAVLEAPGQL